MPDRPQLIRPAAYTLITRGDSLLMCRLCPEEAAAGWWTLPGGGLDFGEAPESGAIRETLEETGLVVTLGELVEIQSEVFAFTERDMHAIRFIYRADSCQGELRHELEGSTDRCAFIPFAALNPEYVDPAEGILRLVPLARRGLEIASANSERAPR